MINSMYCDFGPSSKNYPKRTMLKTSVIRGWCMVPMVLKHEDRNLFEYIYT